MALICKNCGGSISLDRSGTELVCECCGTREPLSAVLNGSGYNGDETAQGSLEVYRYALKIMSSAKTENAFLMAAEEFDEIPEILNSTLLAEECRQKAELLRKERTYNGALIDMQSDEPAKIELAMSYFKGLGAYKDSLKKAEECLPRLERARAEYQKKLEHAEEERLHEEKLKKQKIKKQRRRRNIIVFIAIFAVSALAIGYFKIYSASNIEITISPSRENYLEEKYNGYVFYYDVKIQNNGYLDVSQIDTQIVIEKENEVLIDSAVSFYSYSSVSVRAGKKSSFTWEVEINSYDIAAALYNADFDELDISIEITSVTYANGKTKEY